MTNPTTHAIEATPHDEDLCVIAFGLDCKALASRTLDDMIGFHAVAHLAGEQEPRSVEIGALRINDEGQHALVLHPWDDDHGQPDRSAPVEVEIYGGLARLDVTV